MVCRCVRYLLKASSYFLKFDKERRKLEELLSTLEIFLNDSNASSKIESLFRVNSLIDCSVVIKCFLFLNINPKSVEISLGKFARYISRKILVSMKIFVISSPPSCHYQYNLLSKHKQILVSNQQEIEFHTVCFPISRSFAVVLLLDY